MAKKKAKKAAKPAAKAAVKKAAKKAPAKKAPAKKAAAKKAPAKKAKKAKCPTCEQAIPEIEVEVDSWETMDLDPPVKAAFDLLNASAELGDELEAAAQDALAGTVKTVFGKHGIELSADQAIIVTLALFSDGDDDDSDDSDDE